MEDRQITGPIVMPMLDRKAYLRALMAAESVEKLLSRLRRATREYGIPTFSIYLLEDGELRLQYARETESPGQEGGVWELSTTPEVMSLLSGQADFCFPGSAPFGDRQDSQSSPLVADATVFFALRDATGVLGVAAVFGLVASDALEEPLRSELVELFSAFTSLLRKMRQFDQLRRKLQHASLKLEEFQKGQDVLLQTTREDLLDATLRQTLELVNSQSGMIWLRRGEGWEVAHQVGAPVLDERVYVMVDGTWRENRPLAHSSFTEEPLDGFGNDAIAMVSMAAFPVAIHDEVLGCLVAFDATLSADMLEIVASATSMGATALLSWETKRQVIEQQRAQEQLDLAARVQNQLLPSDEADVKGLSVSYMSSYCDETGGDYVDYLPSQDADRWHFVVGDVSGHGLGAAMVMVDARARLRTFLGHAEQVRPSQTLSFLNNVIAASSGDEFITLALCDIDNRTGRLLYSGAGHEPPLHFCAKTDVVTALPNTGLPLGMLAGETYEDDTYWLEVGDVLVILTDGVTELENAHGHRLDEEDLHAAIVSNATKSAKEILEALKQVVFSHRGESTPVDDMTFLVVKVEETVLQRWSRAPEGRGELLTSEVFKSTLERKDVCLGSIIEILSERHPEADLTGFFVAAEEALANAVRHGNGLNANLSVSVELWDDEGDIHLCVVDEGDGFDPRLALPDLDSAEALNAESGRGVLMMVSLVDRVVYWQNGRGVMLTKTSVGE